MITYFYENDVSPGMREWYNILEYLNIEQVLAEEIWDYARECNKPPHLGNIETGLVLSKIQTWCEDNGIECQYYVNAIASDLVIDGEIVRSLDTFIKLTSKKAA